MELLNNTDLHAQEKLAGQEGKGGQNFVWTTPTLQEKKVFLTMLFLTNNGITPSRMELMFQQKKEEWLLHTPGFWKLLSQKRFQKIKGCLCLSSPAALADQPERSCHIRGLMEHLQSKFEEEYVPGEFITTDECVIPFKGCLHCKQYICSKSVKWRLRIDMLVDQETGYCYRFRFYDGKVELPPPLGKFGFTVCELLKGMEHKGFKLTIDRGYTSPVLAHYLAKFGFGCVGTVMHN